MRSHEQIVNEGRLNESEQEDELYGGGVEQIVGDIVLGWWKLKVHKIVHMVGYDVMNYLIQASPAHHIVSGQLSEHSADVGKYVVKLYRKCTQKQMEIIQVENSLLQQLSAQSTTYPKYPQPVRLCQPQHNTMEVPTDKNIMYILNTQSIHVPHLDQANSTRSIQMQSNHSLSQSVGGQACRQYVKKVRMEIDGSEEVVLVRLLTYIAGTMLGTIIENAQQSTSAQQGSHEYNGIVMKAVPIFIGQSVTAPLYQQTQAYQLESANHKILDALKHRQWEWHMQSFLKCPQFYKQRHQMVAHNKTRPAWHANIIQYFVELYTKVLSQLSQNSNSSGLRKSIIHNDTNQWNIVVSTHEQANCQKDYSNVQVSIIDFGDAVYSYLIEDIAIYTLYAIYNNPTQQAVQQSMLQILGAYTSVMPITEQELRLFYVTVPMRMCVSLCNSEFAIRERPDDAYVSMSQKNGWALLQLLKAMFEDNQDSNIFTSNFYYQLRQVANIVTCSNSQVSSGEKEMEMMSDSSKYGQHWTSQQEFWQEECSKEDKENYAVIQGQELKHVRELMEKYYPQVVQKHQGAEGKVSRMAGYITKNFKIAYLQPNKPTCTYTMKVYRNINRLGNYVQIESIVQNHLIAKQKQILNQQPQSNAHKLYPISLPQPLHPVLDQQQPQAPYVVFYDSFWKCEVLVRLLTYVEGQSFNYYAHSLQFTQQDFENESQNSLGLEKFYNIVGSLGSMLGNLDRLLESALEQLLKVYNKKQLYKLLRRKDYEWNFDHVHVWRKQIKFVKDAHIRDTVECFVQLFQQNVTAIHNKRKKDKASKGSWLRKKLAHMDPNQDNCLISEANSLNPKVDGVIDFDDIQIDFIIVDLVCALAHCFHRIPKIAKIHGTGIYQLHQVYKTAVSRFVSNYHRIYPLNDEEIRCLYYFLAARIGMCIALQSRDMETDPGNQHISFDLEWLCQYIKCLSLIDPKQFQATIRQACLKQHSKQEEGPSES